MLVVLGEVIEHFACEKQLCIDTRVRLQVPTGVTQVALQTQLSIHPATVSLNTVAFAYGSMHQVAVTQTA